MISPKGRIIRDSVAEHVRTIQYGPAFPGKKFVDSTYSYSDVYSIASQLKSLWLNVTSDNAIIGLFSENKAVIAAAMIAAMDSDFILAMPHAYSKQAFHEICQSMHIKAAIVDSPQLLYPDIIPLEPDTQNMMMTYTAPETSVDMDKDLIIFYTGGSTGKPKGWTKSVLNLFSEAVNLYTQYNISPDDHVLSTVPPYHIYGFLFSVLVPFIASASVSNDVQTYPHMIISEIRKQSATVLVSVPVHYHILNGYNIPASSLRLAFSSAGLLDRDDSLSFSHHSGVEVVEVYGSTETGGIASRSRQKGEEAFTPFDLIDWYIQYDSLFIQSDSISRATDKEIDGFFKINDRVTPCGENSFQILGRSDGIVKIGGKRVDLAHVSETIKKIPAVKDAFVISIPTKTGRENLIAALVAGDVNRQMILQDLDGFIENHALPRIIRIVDEIPVTATGKYDRMLIEQLLKNEAE